MLTLNWYERLLFLIVNILTAYSYRIVFKINRFTYSNIFIIINFNLLLLWQIKSVKYYFEIRTENYCKYYRL